MSAHTILLLYVIFFFVEFLWEQLLTLLNMGSVRRNSSAVPAVFKPYIPEDSYRRSVEYTLVRNRFQFISSIVSSALLLLIVTTGTLGIVDSRLSAWNLNAYVHGLLYIFVIAFAFRLFSLPFSLYSQFVIEKRFGFNRMTLKLFLADQLKGTVLSVLLFIPLLLGLFWFMDAAGRFWWLWALVFVTLFQLVISVLYPLFIAPLFNKILSARGRTAS